MRFTRIIVQIILLPIIIFSQQHLDGNLSSDENIHINSENCGQCHLKEYFSTTAPNHLSFQYQPQECQNCHGTEQWKPHVFSHKDRSSEENCISCHMSQLANSNQTVKGHDHLANDCIICHQTERWDKILFNHSSTRYRLNSNEKDQNCLTCHLNGFKPDDIICPDCEPPLKANR